MVVGHNHIREGLNTSQHSSFGETPNIRSHDELLNEEAKKFKDRCTWEREGQNVKIEKDIYEGLCWR